jgi:alpha-mannosidase
MKARTLFRAFMCQKMESIPKCSKFDSLAAMRLRYLFVLASLSAIAAAQAFTPVRELKNLSPGSVEKLHTLETLNALPGGEWHFHAGDLPHGESPTLDDSSWPLVATPAPRHGVKAPKEAVWYRRWIEVPKTLHGYDLTGMRIWFQFDAYANGPMPEIVYFNGRRVALGDDLEPIVLFEPAKPGDKVLVAVKLLHTVDEKTFAGVDMRIEPIDTARPNPDDFRTEVITAANVLPNLPKPRKDLLPTVEKAIDTIDFQALKAEDQKAFDGSLEKAEAILKPLHPVLSQVKLDLTGNAHIDAAWLWPKSETIDAVKRTFQSALQMMNEYPDYTFSQSAAQYSEWMADKYPEINQEIAERVKEGRWEIVGGMWIEPDLNLPGGESLVRQLLVGQREFKSLYGVTARIGWNPDSFGYNWQLPQIYKRSGMDYFVTQKMHWNDTNQLPFRLFWWESPDGSKVLTYFPTDYAWTNVNPTRLSADFADSAQWNPGTLEHMDLYGVGDHGGGPTRDMLDQAQHWIAAGKDGQSIPTMQFHTAQQYFDDVEPHINSNSPVWNYDKLAKGWTAPAAGKSGQVGIPTWKDELYFEFHRGIYTSQAKHKLGMRVSEEQTLDTEKLASFAWLYGDKYPAAELTTNWEKICFNQFHDLAAGSGVAVIYRDAQNEFTEIADSDKVMDDAAFRTLEANINTAVDGSPVVVFNSLPWDRTELVRATVQPDAQTQPLTLVDSAHHSLAAESVSVDPKTHTETLLARVKVPALGYAVLSAQPDCQHSVGDKACVAIGGKEYVKASEGDSSFTLSNDKLQVKIDTGTGCLTSVRNALVAGGSQAEFLAANSCGNQLQAFADTPKQYDAWNVDPGTFDKAPTIISKVDSIALVQDTPLRKTVRIQRTWQASHFTQDISLDAGADVVRIENTIDWQESHVLLKAAFPLAATSAKATYEIPYGSIQRPTTRDNSFSKAQFEVPALRWADLGDDKQGVSILNDSKYGYDGVGNMLRITLLRSPTWPDANADKGMQHFTYEIYPHPGSWQKAETIHRAYELNQPLTAMQTFAHAGSLPAEHSFVRVDQPNVVLSAVKKAEDEDALVFRMYEATGQATTVTLHIPAGATAATETNLMEAPTGGALPLANDTITVPIKPYEILTVQAAYSKK